MTKAASDPGTEQGSRATLNTRLSPEVKATLQRAADLRGQTLSEFVLGAAYDRAAETIEQNTVLRLTARDAEAFAAALESAPMVDDAVVGRFVAAHRRSRSLSHA